MVPGYSEIRNFLGGDGQWHCTLGEIEPTGFDGSGKYWRHFVGSGATADDARTAAALATEPHQQENGNG